MRLLWEAEEKRRDEHDRKVQHPEEMSGKPQDNEMRRRRSGCGTVAQLQSSIRTVQAKCQKQKRHGADSPFICAWRRC